MSKSLTVITSKLPSVSKRIKFTLVGMAIHPNVTEVEWRSAGEFVSFLDKGRQFQIGDWIIYARKRWKWPHGELMKRAAEVFPWYDERTLENFVYVAENVEISRRRENLSWTHHSKVAMLPNEKQVYFLQMAIDNEWSSDELADQIKPPNTVETPLDKKERKREVDADVKVFRAAALQSVVNGEDLDIDFYYSAVRKIAGLVGKMRKKARVADHDYVVPVDAQEYDTDGRADGGGDRRDDEE